ncbi:MAG: hypothetical protein ISR51_05410 [Rhodospirillales bacterium]|nr:hypothetical protein [Alphaproteobacteria bacterium]MBL6948097.1 hypothetical protein [Rhodospirillales bacterium]
MSERTFGGHSLAEIKKLRNNPADGANFYMALRDAAPDLFQLAEDFEMLEMFVQTLVDKIEAAANGEAADTPREDILQGLKETLDDPEIRKIIASR